MDKLKLAEQTLVKDDMPGFKAGDTINVHYRVREGEKERIQQFEGDVVSRQGSGANKTFVVRKVSAGNIGVERIFPLYSPFIAKIEVKKEGDVRRSKLYYLRDRSGKAARIKEKDHRQDADVEELEFADTVTPEETEAALSDEADVEVSDEKKKEAAEQKAAEPKPDESEEKEKEKKPVEQTSTAEEE